MGKKPIENGNVQDNENNNLGDLALWDQDFDNEDAPDRTGVLNLDADKVREILDNNSDASEISLNISVWED